MLYSNPLVNDDRVMVVNSAEEYTAAVFLLGHALGSPLVLRAREVNEDVVAGKDVVYINAEYDDVPAAVKAVAKSIRCETVKL